MSASEDFADDELTGALDAMGLGGEDYEPPGAHTFEEADEPEGVADDDDDEDYGLDPETEEPEEEPPAPGRDDGGVRMADAALKKYGRLRFDDPEVEKERQNVIRMAKRVKAAVKEAERLRPIEEKARRGLDAGKLSKAMEAAGIDPSVSLLRAELFLEVHEGKMPRSGQHLIAWLREYHLLPA